MGKGIFIKKQVDSEFCFDLTADDGLVLCRSVNYDSDAECARAMEAVREDAAAPAEDQTEENFEEIGFPRYEIYKDDNGELRFILRDKDGEIIAVAPQGFAAGYTIREGIKRIAVFAPDATVLTPTYSKPTAGFVNGQPLNN